MRQFPVGQPLQSLARDRHTAPPEAVLFVGLRGWFAPLSRLVPTIFLTHRRRLSPLSMSTNRARGPPYLISVTARRRLYFAPAPGPLRVTGAVFKQVS